MDITLSLGLPTNTLSAQFEQATPVFAPDGQDNEDWELELMKVLHKAKDTQKVTTTRNRELQAL